MSKALQSSYDQQFHVHMFPPVVILARFDCVILLLYGYFLLICDFSLSEHSPHSPYDLIQRKCFKILFCEYSLEFVDVAKHSRRARSKANKISSEDPVHELLCQWFEHWFPAVIQEKTFLYIFQDAFADGSFVKIGFLHRPAGFRGNSGQTGCFSSSFYSCIG